MAKLYIKNTDGTFAPHSSIAVTKLDVVQSKGNSLTSAMSQKAVTDELATKQNTLTDTDGSYGQRVANLEKEGIASNEKLTELEENTSESISKINDLGGGEIIKDILSQSEWQNGRVTINSIQNSTLFQYIKFTAAKNDIIHYKGRNELNSILLACKSVEESAKTIIVNGEGIMTEGDVVAPIDGEYWFCVQSEFKDSSILTISHQATGRVNDIEDEIDLLSSSITDVKKIIGALTIESIDLTDGYISGSYIKKNGTLTSFTSGRISKQIPLSKGQQVAFTGRVADVMVAIAVYDNGAYIPKVVGLDYTQYITYKYVADDDCIVVLCSAYDHTNDYAEIGATISERLDNLDKKTENLITIDSFGLEEMSNNPLERLKEGGFASIVRSWAFIGDSMASGATLGYEQGASSATEKDDYWASWGQFICRMHGSEGYNYSVGGESAKSWCVSEDNGRRWQKLQSQKHEAYIVALGQNDTYWVNSNDQNTQVRNYPCISAYPNRDSFKSEGLVITEDDVRADIDLTDYNNNAETFVGYYAGIIQRIKSTNDLGYIFLMTNPQATAPNQPIYYKYYNDCIRHIYNIFKAIYPDTVWLIEMDKYSHYKDIKTQIALNGLHFGAFGYKWSALEINTYIDWIIRNNISAFQGISLVLDNKKPTSW